MRVRMRACVCVRVCLCVSVSVHACTHIPRCVSHTMMGVGREKDGKQEERNQGGEAFCQLAVYRKWGCWHPDSLSLPQARCQVTESERIFKRKKNNRQKEEEYGWVPST